MEQSPTYHISITTLLGFLNRLEDDEQRFNVLRAALDIISNRNEIEQALNDAMVYMKNSAEEYEQELKNQSIRFCNLMRLAGVDGEQYL